MFRKENQLKKNTKGGVVSEKGGANRNQAHLGLPEGSKRRRCLLVEATLLTWASWAVTTSLFSPINRGKRAEQKVQPFWYLRILSKLVRKIVSLKKIQVKFLP